MCSKEEVQKIVDASESRIEDKIDTLEHRYDRLLKSHMAIDKTISHTRNDAREARDSAARAEKKVNDMHKTFSTIDWPKLQEIVISVQGFTAVKNIFSGAASVVLSLGALGAGLTWLIKSLVK